MGRMGYGYGSEWQLTRFLGRHRGYFTTQVADACDLSGIEWLDFGFKESDWLGDGELLGLDFVPDEGVKAQFREWWPHGSGIMNWDAVGRGVDHSGDETWVLVEAKGNIPELRSSCGAGPASLKRIEAALEETKAAFGIEESGSWTSPYYQHANRLAVLHFLMSRGVNAHLVDVFFHGRTESDDRSPVSSEDWIEALVEMHDHLGLSGGSDVERRVHSAFVKISGA